MCLYMPAGMKYWGFDKLSEYCHAPNFMYESS
jgi:hypothetical protein